MVLLKGTGGVEKGNTTLVAGYEWHFNCNLQPSRSGKHLSVSKTDLFLSLLLFCNLRAGMKIFDGYPVCTYITSYVI